MRLDEWLRQAEARLSAAGITSARLETQVLARHILRVDRSWILTHPDHEFNELAGEALLQRREAHEPLAYITGSREFFGRNFRVTPAVLIPRHETEVLVETALARVGPKATVLDVGTGSGCIAITLKLERPDWDVSAVDISPNALEVARDNAQSLQADVRWIHSDRFAEVLGESFDLIVSNPPYIGVNEPLSSEVVDHEPHLALFGGETGLEFYRRLAVEAPNYLSDAGLLLLEVGYRQAAAVRDLFVENGWEHFETVEDLDGTPRVVALRYPHPCALPK
jgi:release factor glutamine methyltransferase